MTHWGSNNTRHAPAHWTGFAGQLAKWRGIHEIHHGDTEFTEEN